MSTTAIGVCSPAQHPELCRDSSGKERDETGLDYFLARYFSSALGRFTSPDPIFIKNNRFKNPQRLNLYNYGVNNPLVNIDPDGRDAIAVVFPDYKITAFGRKMSGLGHAGIVTIDSKGRTRYYEYGRYPGSNKDAPPGRMRRLTIMDVKMDANGRVTKESMKALMGELSEKAGQGGRVEGAYFDTTDEQTKDMNEHADGIKEQNESEDKEAYDMTDNNCGTVVDDVLEAGGQDTPWIVDPRPNSIIKELQGAADQKIEYDPEKQQLELK
jgi:RHS repeat-associated protein